MPAIEMLLEDLLDQATADIYHELPCNIPQKFYSEIRAAVTTHLQHALNQPRPSDRSNTPFMQLLAYAEVTTYFELLQLASLLCAPPQDVVEDALHLSSEDGADEPSDANGEASEARKLRRKFENFLIKAAGIDRKAAVATTPCVKPVDKGTAKPKKALM